MVYLTLPILDELVRFVEGDSACEDSVKAMTSGILSYFFTATDGYNVCSNFPNFIIRQYSGDRGFIDHTLVQAKRASDNLEASLNQLENSLEHIKAKCYWAIMVHRTNLMFYEYHQNLPPHERLIPWGPPNQRRRQFNARDDSVEVDWVMRHMSENDAPAAR